MKKLFYLIMIAILCLAFFACNKNKNTEETPVPSGGTLAGTQIGNSGQNTPSEFGDPDKIYYNYDASGFGITEVHLDEKGRPIKETLYTIDQTYGVIAPTMSMESTYDENNKLLRANGEYLSLSVYAPKNIKIKVSKSEDQNFGYEISQKEGFVSAYINLVSDEDGRPVKTEYFTRGGRLVYTEFIKYHLNGERKLITVLDPDNETLYECEYNENGT